MWSACVLLLLAASSAANASSRRNKRQDYWSWGLVEDIEPTNSQLVSATPTDDEANACLPYTSTMPDFYKPGRRISETKCFEYDWQIKDQEERDQKEKACLAYRRRKAGLHSFRNLVVGGRRALQGEYPHMGAIGWRAVEGTWVFKCGGALISPRFVLTAAHCTKSSRDPTVAEAAPKIVRLGARNILDTPEPHDERITRIIVHPYFTAPRKYNDIALLQLSKDVEFSRYIQPACLWTSLNTSTISGATITGWGVVAEGSRDSSPNLKTAEVDVIEPTTCDGLLRRYCNRNWCGLDQAQICAGKPSGGVDTCQGDSGGPLQVRAGSLTSVVGVTSFGFGCARAGAPGVYTKVAAFREWIEQHVWG
ncbi:serine protease snake-like [Leguminivora glycinivorella]|uniref:serine protease snake-like n=1 Tax=Leguminivora glycinivorella TaxID=1035111 RepID=UPI00200EC248|nr:serine protease snake-like [Leguminivora glycinivorella]